MIGAMEDRGSPVAREPRYDARRFPPAVRGPRAAQTARMTRDPIRFLEAQRAALGPVFTLRIFPFRAGLVCAADAKLNREVLTDQERFVGGDAAWLLEPIVGPRSLILTPPPPHLRNRKLLLPPFHGERVALWAERVRDLVRLELPSLVTGEPVSVRPWAQRLTLDVILRVIFGLTDPAPVAAFRSALDRLAARSIQALLFAPTALRRDLGPRSPGGILAARRAAVDALIATQIESRRATGGECASPSRSQPMPSSQSGSME